MVFVVKYFSSLIFVWLSNLGLMYIYFSSVLWSLTLSSWILKDNSCYQNLVFNMHTHTHKKKAEFL